MHPARISFVAMLVVTSVTHSISGQTTQPEAPAARTVPSAAHARDTLRTDLVMVNPLGLVFSVYNGEYEHVISRSATLGLGGTVYAPSDFTYSSGELKLRYYPQENAPRGFSLALSAGATNVRGTLFCFDVCNKSSKVYPTAGIELDYNWLLGPTRRFVVGTGIGAKRLFGSHDDGSDTGLPTVRLSIGAAF